MPDQFSDFIDEEFLRKLENLKILSRKGVRGPERGEHISWRSGASLEFLDYRKYQIGDDLRYVDWNVYGRLDKLFIKLFRAEENQTIHILIDTSRSMAAGDPSKEMCAKKIAAAVSYICLVNLDRVRVTSFSTRLSDSMSPARSQQAYAKVLKYLASFKSEGETDVNACLSTYAATRKRRGVVLILSDVLDPKGYREGLEALMYEKFDIALIQILDPFEISPVLKGYYRLQNIEGAETRVYDISEEMIAAYRKKMAVFMDDIREYCLTNEIDYYLYNTGVSFENFLLEYLTNRLVF